MIIMYPVLFGCMPGHNAHLACCLVVAELAQEEDLLHALLVVEVQIEDPE